MLNVYVFFAPKRELQLFVLGMNRVVLIQFSCGSCAERFGRVTTVHTVPLNRRARFWFRLQFLNGSDGFRFRLEFRLLDKTVPTVPVSDSCAILLATRKYGCTEVRVYPAAMNLTLQGWAKFLFWVGLVERHICLFQRCLL